MSRPISLLLCCLSGLLLAATGCAEKNLAMKQQLLDQKNQVETLNSQIAAEQARHQERARQAEVLEQQAVAAQTESARQEQRLNQVAEQLRTLQKSVAALERTTPGYESIELTTGEILPVLLEAMEEGALRYTTMEGHAGTQALEKVKSIRFREVPAP